MESLNSTFSPSSSILDFRQDPRNTQSLTGSIERRLRLFRIAKASKRILQVHFSIICINFELQLIAQPTLEIFRFDDCFEKSQKMFWKCSTDF